MLYTVHFNKKKIIEYKATPGTFQAVKKLILLAGSLMASIVCIKDIVDSSSLIVLEAGCTSGSISISIPTLQGSGTRNIKKKHPNANIIMAFIIKIQYQLVVNTSLSSAASWMPTIFPKLLHVAHNPTNKPLFFFGIQFAIIDTKVGNATELKIPINPNTGK